MVRRRLAAVEAELERFDRYAAAGVELREWGRPVDRGRIERRRAELELELLGLGGT